MLITIFSLANEKKIHPPLCYKTTLTISHDAKCDHTVFGALI